jgi:hypothetical protein
LLLLYIYVRSIAGIFKTFLQLGFCLDRLVDSVPVEASATPLAERGYYAAFAYLLAEIQTQQVEIHDRKSMVMRYGQQASYYQQFFNPPLLQKLHIGEHELGGSNGTSIEIYLKVYDWDTGDGEYSHLMDFSAKEVTDFSFYMMKRGNTGQVSWKFQSGNG